MMAGLGDSEIEACQCITAAAAPPLTKMYCNVFWHGSCIWLFLTFIWNVFACVPAWRLLCSDLPIPGCCSCVLPPGGRVTSRHGRPSRFNPPFQNFDQSHPFWPFSEAFFSSRTSSGPKLWSLLKKGRAENVGRGRAVRFKKLFKTSSKFVLEVVPYAVTVF